MRVPDVVLRCVGFIGEAVQEDSGGISGDLLATGFFIGDRCQSPELATHRMGYFVTAAHVARAFHDKPIQIIVNKRGGGVTRMTSVLGDAWWHHPTDRAADVAIIPVMPQADADTRGVATKDFVYQNEVETRVVGIGDETCITGLFTEAPGQSRMTPIVRHGNVAMLPDEKIQTELGYADVYLIEARSIGGLSGSPVFVKTEGGTGVKLLGVVQAHWDIREAELNNPAISHDRKHGVNLGIAVVTPAQKIIDIIESEYARERIAEIEAIMLAKTRKSVPGTDMAKPKGGAADFTKEDFESALKKASRKVESK